MEAYQSRQDRAGFIEYSIDSIGTQEFDSVNFPSAPSPEISAIPRFVLGSTIANILPT
jgi:hypothetical protein